MQFLTAEDAFHRLALNVIKLNNRPVFVLRVFVGDDRQTKMTYRDLETGRETTIDPNSDFIFPPKFQLGYINYYQDRVLRPIFCERTPLRARAMGLNLRNLMIYDVSHSDRVAFNTTLLVREEFYKMLENQYPKISEGLKMTNAHGFAFSRDFALDPISVSCYALYYRGVRIGEFDKKVLTLYQDYEYFAELLQEALDEKGESFDIVVHKTETVA